MGQICLMLSANGGMGKTTLTAALANAVVQRGKSCCCIEPCASIPCLSLLLDDAVSDGNENQKCFSLPKLPKEEALAGLREWKKQYDYVLVDSPAGLHKSLSPYLEAADRLLLLLRPDPVSVSCTEKLLSLLSEKTWLSPVLVVNRMHPLWVRKAMEASPRQLADHLHGSLLGFIPEDGEMARLWTEGFPLLKGRRDITKALNRVAGRFLGEYVPMPSLVPGIAPAPVSGKEADGCSIIQDIPKPIST